MMKVHGHLNIILFFLLMFSVNNCNSQKFSEEEYTHQRVHMVEQQIKARGINNTDVINSLLKVKRHLFVPPGYRHQAYGDFPLPIGFNQTISQPYVVAYMTEILEPEKNMRVLEIGTGSGYQAAVIAEICKEVYSIELIDSLAIKARETLASAGYKNIRVKSGDGYLGWPEYAPFNAIIVTCAQTEIPQTLIDQLAEGGRMIIPAGEKDNQVLVLLQKKNGKIHKTETLPVRFVPMLRPDKREY
jgi:protein-L-isoaspartate(D-aspartate) O-methyltransferase